jgi:UDP-N-acetylmuramyl tripeptide synthase
MKGQLHADIAVLELDEAHAVHFVRTIQPRYSLLLNVMRDQLDRFGEIDKTAGLLARIAEQTTDTVVMNREDPRVSAIALSLDGPQVAYFGLDAKLRPLFPTDDELRHSGLNEQISPTSLPADVILQKVSKDNKATFVIDGKAITTSLKLQGVYNIFNAAAALALTRVIVGDKLDQPRLTTALSDVQPAFGRGETLLVNGKPLELVLVKNPSGFRLGLQSFDPAGYATMIAINDNYADGRDMSWLWDVEFDSLRPLGVQEVTGLRAYDIALRLQYDDVAITHIDSNIQRSLKHFLQIAGDKPKRVFCTYTAMLAIRRELAKITEVEVIS